MISNSDDAKKELVRLGFPPVFLEIADGIIPKGLNIHKPFIFYTFLPDLFEIFPEAENFLPLWEYNGEAVIAFDLKRKGFFSFYFEDGDQETKETKIANLYEEFVVFILSKADEAGHSKDILEDLAIRLNYRKIREFRAFLARETSKGGNPRFLDYLHQREIHPEPFIAEEIQAFRSAQLNQNGESPLKNEIIENLERNLDSPTVVEFLLEVISDPEEYDLARIEALKIFQCWDVPSPELKTRIGERLAGVIRDDSDDLVQEWAGIAARNYVQVPEVLAASIEVLTNPEAGINARHNCLSAVEFFGPTPQTIGTLESLLEDEEIGWAIPMVLTGWEKPKKELR